MIYRHNNELRTTLLEDDTASTLLKNILMQMYVLPPAEAEEGAQAETIKEARKESRCMTVCRFESGLLHESLAKEYHNILFC